MSGRRSVRRERHGEFPSRSPFFWSRVFLIVGVAVVVAVAVSAVMYILNRPGSSAAAHCEHPQEITVATEDTLVAVLHGVADQVPAADCLTFLPVIKSQAETAAGVTSGAASTDLWLADSAVRVQRIVATKPPEIVVPSIATTPAVVGRKGEVPAFATWISVLQTPGVHFGDPLASGSGTVALMGALSEVEAGQAPAETGSAALVPLAQNETQRSGDKRADATQLEGVATGGGTAIVTEQSWLAYGKYPAASGLIASVPQSGSVSLEYPVVVTSTDDARRTVASNAAKVLEKLLASDAGRAALASQGYRQPDMAKTADSLNVGDVVALQAPGPDNVLKTLKGWAMQTIPFRSLVVMDVSGSMNFQAGEQTRMQLTQHAATAGSKMFPNSAALGMWAFSIGLGGGSQDYIELNPIRKMDAVIDGVSQRDRLLADIAGLDQRTGGATGLFDTTLADYRTVKANYDPRAVNSVILFTDGANEDPDSLTLDQLLETLQREQDPAKPVVIVSIGITEDADAETLKKISAATGGTSYVAKDPKDIPTVFVDALLARGK